MRIAIVGAGLAGLMAARVLRESAEVVVFEKNAEPGGRCTTHREFGVDFDHGAQYLTCRSEALTRFLDRWRSTGLIQKWVGPFVSIDESGLHEVSGQPTRYVACPGMDALGKALCNGVQFRGNRAVKQVEYTDSWRIECDDGSSGEGFDGLVLALPYAEVSKLLDNDDLPQGLTDPRMATCWATVAAFGSPLHSTFAGAFVNRGPLSWLALNHSKPGRSATSAVVLHATPQWSQEHEASHPEWVSGQLLDAANALLDLPRPTNVRSLYWPAARALDPIHQGALSHHRFPLVVCGDWCHGNRVEGALLSGLCAAERILTYWPVRTDLSG